MKDGSVKLNSRPVLESRTQNLNIRSLGNWCFAKYKKITNCFSEINQKTCVQIIMSKICMQLHVTQLLLCHSYLEILKHYAALYSLEHVIVFGWQRWWQAYNNSWRPAKMLFRMKLMHWLKAYSSAVLQLQYLDDKPASVRNIYLYTTPIVKSRSSDHESWFNHFIFYYYNAPPHIKPACISYLRRWFLLQ